MKPHENDLPLPQVLAAYPEVMTVAEVAEVLRMRTTSVIAGIADGSLPGFRVGGGGTRNIYRTLRSDLARVIDGTWTRASPATEESVAHD